MRISLLFSVFVSLLLSLFIVACDPVEAAEGEGEGEGEGEELEGAELFERLAGLWAGPADSQTSLGDFPLMSMDHRAADQALFARGDLDADNAIRWWIWRDDEGRLRFENGGFFQGFFRSDSCALETASEDTYRFCHLAQGCDHIDASFRFEGEDLLTLQVVVNGAPHVTWQAERVETRDLPAGFPSAALEGEPALPDVEVSASFSEAAGADADAWLVLTTEPCGLTFQCDASRSFLHPVAPGARTTSFTVNEVHPGAYFAFLLVDNNGNFRETLRPDAGDFVSQPDRPLTVSESGGEISMLAGAF